MADPRWFRVIRNQDDTVVGDYDLEEAIAAAISESLYAPPVRVVTDEDVLVGVCTEGEWDERDGWQAEHDEAVAA